VTREGVAAVGKAIAVWRSVMLEPSLEGEAAARVTDVVKRWEIDRDGALELTVTTDGDVGACGRRRQHGSSEQEWAEWSKHA
jgi:hypothetical protein